MTSKWTQDEFALTCANGHVWVSYEIDLSFFYGTFLLETADGEMAILDAVDDQVFSEVSELLAGLSAAKHQKAEASLLHCVFGVACDRSPAGLRFDIPLGEGEDICATCGSRDVKSEATGNSRQIEIPSVTHVAWLRLERSEKIEILKAEVIRCSEIPR